MDLGFLLSEFAKDDVEHGAGNPAGDHEVGCEDILGVDQVETGEDGQ